MKLYPRLSFIIFFILVLNSNIFATIYAKTNMEKFVASSTLVVKAKVLSTESKWDQTHTKIFTYTTISILEILKGENPPTELTIEQLGGTVGDESLVIETNPQFKEGEEAILFLVFHNNSWWLNSIGMSKFDILTVDGTEVAVNANVPPKVLESEIEKFGDSEILTFNFLDFKQEIIKLANKK